jgi:hypothetical protein
MMPSRRGNVRRFIPAILALVILLMFSSAALAQEPSRYNFASAQGSTNINVTPNGESSGSVYFYNIDGNQITHIVLEVSQAPANWQVTIQPALGETRVDIGGKIVSVNETLYIEPSQVLSQKVDNPPAGMVCITVPQRGYALGKEAKVVVRVPSSEKIGAKADIVVSATAKWLGQTGSVAITQNRDFTFSVEVVSPSTGTQEKILGKSTPGVDTGGTTGKTTVKWQPIIIGAAAVVVIALLILLYIRRRRD